MNSPAENAATVLEALDRLEALEQAHSRDLMGYADTVRYELDAQFNRAEAAEAERDAARTLALERADALFATQDERDAAVRAAEQAQGALRRVGEEARQGKIHSESVSINEEWPVHETIHRFSVIRQIARAALSAREEGADSL